MKSAMLVAVACLLILLPGCAQQPVARSAAGDRIDYQQMAAVEQQASVLGVKVYWIHPPEKTGTTRQSELVHLALSPGRRNGGASGA